LVFFAVEVLLVALAVAAVLTAGRLAAVAAFVIAGIANAKAASTATTDSVRFIQHSFHKGFASNLEYALRILLVRVDSRFHDVGDRLIDDKLPVIANEDLETIHRTRGGTFEVQPADVVARPMTWALELLFCLKPSRGASQVSALGENRVEAELGANYPVR
jgi:hypothetical protein